MRGRFIDCEPLKLFSAQQKCVTHAYLAASVKVLSFTHSPGGVVVHTCGAHKTDAGMSELPDSGELHCGARGRAAMYGRETGARRVAEEVSEHVAPHYP